MCAHTLARKSKSKSGTETAECERDRENVKDRHGDTRTLVYVRGKKRSRVWPKKRMCETE